MTLTNSFSTKKHNIVNVVKKTIDKVEKFAHKFEAKLAHAATDLAYKLQKGNEIYKQHESKTLENIGNEGWKILCNSSEFVDTNLNGFKSVVLVNEVNKNVLIATAGTTADINDVRDDFYITRGNFPSKALQAKEMVNHTTKLLGADASKYQYNFTGHSLGSVVSDLAAYEAMSKGLKLGTSVTFDSPGSRAAINEARKAKIFTDNTCDIDDLAAHCVVYNAKHNLINYLEDAIKLIPGVKYLFAAESPHITAPHLVLASKANNINVADLKSTSEQLGIWGFANYLSSKLGSVVKACSEHLGIKKVLDELEHTMTTHSLKNFADLCEKVVVPTEDWKKLDGQLVINPKDNLKELTKITPTGNDVITLFMETNRDNYEEISKKEYAFNDLVRAQSYEDINTRLIGDAELTNFDIIH